MPKAQSPKVVNFTRLYIGLGLAFIGCLSIATGFWISASWDGYAITGGIVSFLTGGIISSMSREHLVDALLTSLFGALGF
jgi:hypothetical protein